MQVQQLAEHFARRQESAITALLSDFAVTDDASSLQVNGSSFPLDETSTAVLAKFLKVPASYLKSLDPDFRATTLRYHFQRHQQVQAVVESLNDNLMAVHQPTDLMLPIAGVAEVITKVMKPEDEVRRVSCDESILHVDVTSTTHTVEFSPPPGEALVGDVTEAGLRVLSYPHRTRKPSVSSYLHRLACTNGMCTEERQGQISLKGKTVDEVLVEMEEAATLVLSQLDDKLNAYAKTREMIVPGTPQAFAQQLAREANVSRRVLDAVLDIVNQLPAPVSVWDIQNAFTSVANQLPYATMMRLQSLGGHLAMDAERMIDRCNQCERLL